MSERAIEILSARIALAEARARCGRQRGFAFLLLTWAGNARRRAATAVRQRELFK